MVAQITEWFEISSRLACGLVLLCRGSFFYRSRAQDYSALKMRIRDLAMTRVRFGYPRLTVMFKREGWDVGKRLVYRLYDELLLLRALLLLRTDEQKVKNDTNENQRSKLAMGLGACAEVASRRREAVAEKNIDLSRSQHHGSRAWPLSK